MKYYGDHHLPQIIIACCTSMASALFPRVSWLGASFKAIQQANRVKLILKDSNKGESIIGLGQYYNSFISSQINQGKSPDTILVFCHDDIYLHDWNLAWVLNEGLNRYDLIGPIGCREASSDQPGWASELSTAGRHKFLPFSRVKPSGSINHYDYLRVIPDCHPPIGQPCVLLDGCFLAIRLGTLMRHTDLRFDEQFRFHCYDSDFCRQVLTLGLTIGSWPILVSHQSGGTFGDDWSDAALRFQKKWAKRPLNI